MHSDQQIKHWTPICDLAEIVPNTGVAALVDDQQVAIFHVIDSSAGQAQARVFAIGNFDPNSEAAVLSRGVGSWGRPQRSRSARVPEPRSTTKGRPCACASPASSLSGTAWVKPWIA